MIENEDLDGQYVDHKLLISQVEDILISLGSETKVSRRISEIIVDADMRGVQSHGVSMLPIYSEMHRQGHLDFSVTPEVQSISANQSLVDARKGLGHLGMATGMDRAISDAHKHGLSTVAVQNSHHFGAAGYYARMASEQGLIALVFSTTSTPAVLPTRGAEPLLGTNPIACSIPAKLADKSLVLDMSTSTVAVNKVKIYAALGLNIPAGWVYDGHGAPLTNSQQAYDLLSFGEAGGLSPLGGPEVLSGYKGFGLNLVVQLLAGGLSGSGRFPRSVGESADDIGHFAMVIDPRSFPVGDVFYDYVETVLHRVRESTPVSNDEPVVIPGDIEADNFLRSVYKGVYFSSVEIEMLRNTARINNAKIII